MRFAPCAATAILVFGPWAAASGDDPGPEPSDDWAVRWEAGGSLRIEWAPSTTSSETQKLRAILQPHLRVELPWELGLTAIGRLTADAVDELEPGDPYLKTYSRPSRPADFGDRTELELRELYLDADLGPALVRLGKQQIVWGEADGLKILDIVNPQSFLEFILPAFEDSRIPQWSANVEIPFRSSDLQLIVVPDPTFNRIPGLAPPGGHPMNTSMVSTRIVVFLAVGLFESEARAETIVFEEGIGGYQGTRDNSIYEGPDVRLGLDRAP